jgi:hypothetical protein
MNSIKKREKRRIDLQKIKYSKCSYRDSIYYMSRLYKKKIMKNITIQSTSQFWMDNPLILS